MPQEWSPHFLPDTDNPFIDDEYHREELQRMDWQEIRAIAAEVDVDEIDGQSDREEMEEVLVGVKRID